MKKTENTKTTKTVENNDLQIIGKKFVFVINNDEQTEKTDTACQAFREWLKTPQNNKKYINKYGIVGGDWQVDIAEVNSFTHIATAQDNLTGGKVDVIYITFNNQLLNRFVYIDSTLRENGLILLPIDGDIKSIAFGFKYASGTRKRTTKKSTTTQKSTPTKTENKTPTKTPKTEKTTATKTTTEKTNGDNK